MRPNLEDLEAHFRCDDVVQEYASFDFLLPPEAELLARYRTRIAGTRILDLGVGAGRTTHHFGPLASTYVGIDLSKPMVEACRKAFASLPGVAFHVADARDLRGFADESFDVVLFSFNGLDPGLLRRCVGSAGREACFLSPRTTWRSPGPRLHTGTGSGPPFVGLVEGVSWTGSGSFVGPSPGHRSGGG